jgi:hypothetical protein|nr:MAG TPA: minor capsid protein [Caudoviricetes sp.]
MQKVTPHQLDLWSSNFSDLYNAFEGEIIRQLIKRLSNGKTDILEWQAQAMKDLHLFNKDVARYLAEITGVGEEVILNMMSKAGVGAVESVDNEVPYDAKPMPTNIDNVVRAYANQAWIDIDNLVNQTLISTNFGYGSVTTQTYQEVLRRTSALFNAGTLTMDQALERAIQELAQKGINSTFIDKGGHTWSMERYVRTVLKSTLGNTYNELRTERMIEYGTYLVRVSQHAGAREACSKIQGHVVDIRPTEQLPIGSRYRSIYDPYWHADYKMPGGHRGVNCGHSHFVFFEGVNTNTSELIDQALNAKVRELTDKQRRYERQIVKFKKNLMVSQQFNNQEGVEKWSQKVRANQKALRELVASSEYLSRDYKREKVYTPLDTLLKDFRYDNF